MTGDRVGGATATSIRPGANHWVRSKLWACRLRAGRIEHGVDDGGLMMTVYVTPVNLVAATACLRRLGRSYGPIRVHLAEIER
jgi:hypothetical protein